MDQGATINTAGNTHGRIVDERYRRDLGEGFLSYYDETKYLAHRAAQERILRTPHHPGPAPAELLLLALRGAARSRRGLH